MAFTFGIHAHPLAVTPGLCSPPPTPARVHSGWIRETSSRLRLLLDYLAAPSLSPSCVHDLQGGVADPAGLRRMRLGDLQHPRGGPHPGHPRHQLGVLAQLRKPRTG